MNKIFNNGSFIYRAEISRPPYPADSFHFLITSQLLGTRFSGERRRQFDATLSRSELTKLRDIIDLHLGAS